MTYEITQDVPILAGQGALQALCRRLTTQFRTTKAALVYGPAIHAAGTIGLVQQALAQSGISYIEYANVERDAPDYSCDELGQLIARSGCDAILAVGGGSTLDTAKGGAVVACNGGSVRDYLIQRPARLAGRDSAAEFSRPVTHKQTIPLIMVPTTSGSGSELRLTGIIHDTELDKKDSVVYRPSLAVLEPELFVSMPPSVTATSAFDALAHASEGMTSRMGKDKLRCTILGAGVIETIFTWLPAALRDPENLQAREALATAASLAALCSTDGLAHIGHNTADTLNYHCNLSHAHACALALPPVIQLTAPYAADSVRRIARAQGLSLTGDETPQQLGALTADAFRALARQAQIPGLRTLGISREQLLTSAVIDDMFLNQKLLHLFPAEHTLTQEEAAWILTELYDRYE